MGSLERELTDERISEIVEAVSRAVGTDDRAKACEEAQPLIRVLKNEPQAARALSRLIARGSFERERGLELASALFDAYQEDVLVISNLGNAFSSLHDIDFLNSAPPSDALFSKVAQKLRSMVEKVTDQTELSSALDGLAVAARVLGRTWDSVAEAAQKRLCERDSAPWYEHYNLGLFYKTRGRFREGQAANQRAFDGGGKEKENVRWNLGICATGARDGETALRVWKEMGQKIEMGRFGLPEGGYAGVKVRLAERPLAERDPATEPDDAGCEETIWVERLSPCHGIVRSALYYDEIGVDFGDVVLFDGAPITHHKYGETSVPVFPHLVTLERPGYRIYRFAGTQKHAKQIADLSETLPEDAVLYTHTEQFVELCASCWRDPGVDHANHQTVERHVVTGKLCAPPTFSPRAFLAALDAVLQRTPEVQVYAPDLVEAAGDRKRADIERRRTAMISSD